jgi:hypothetical protein
MVKIFFLLFLSLSLQAQTVYKTPTGAKYHLSNCRTVKNVSERVTIEQAKKLGLQPCKVCNPINIYGNQLPVKKAQGQKEATVQCRGITKAGTRCRHKTSIGNGYCFQHTPK